ncbi:hypothetical protein AADZ86_08685 [Colwelliaceae bacterium BS250]
MKLVEQAIKKAAKATFFIQLGCIKMTTMDGGNTDNAGAIIGNYAIIFDTTPAPTVLL